MLQILNVIILAISILIAMSFHELAHGFVSYKLGDPTPKTNGRLTLNPLAHIDPIGTICMFVFGFGWAKPVSINSYYYKNKKAGIALVSLAGPCANFIIAFISVICIKLFVGFNNSILTNFFMTLFSVNIGLGTFNLIPIPPLDGSKILAGLMPQSIYDKWMAFERYGMFILLVVLYIGILDPILMTAIGFVQNLMFGIVGL